MKHIFSVLFIMFFLLACEAINSQTNKKDTNSCVKKFNLYVDKILLEEICNNNINISLDSVNVIFELSLNEEGKTGVLLLRKSNLRELGFNEDVVISKIKQKKWPCLYTIYYQKKSFPPNRLFIPYNRDVLKK